MKTKLSGYDRRHAEHDARTTALGDRILKVEQSVADRVARIETKVDLLLSAWFREFKRPSGDGE